VYRSIAPVTDDVVVDEAPSLRRCAVGSVNIASGSGRYILVVDDAATNRKMLCRILQSLQLSCQCDETADGQHAVDLMQRNLWISQRGDDTSHSDDVMPFSTEDPCTRPYYAVLMDFTMPVMSGPEATKLMRDMGFRGLIVGVTGHMDVHARNEFIASGADEVLTKPVDSATLVTLLYH
jgi:CheY-like chemotaxis protein